MPRTVPANMQSPKSGPHRLLLVDDDDMSLDFLSIVLSKAGYAVDRAKSAAEALERLRAGAHDLALLDLNMPDMSGLQLAQHLRVESAVPFIFVSGHKDIGLVREATRCGALGYVIKSVDPAQIVPAVEAALASAEELRELRRTERELGAALSAGRETSMAVGLLMGKFQTDRHTAYNVLRDHARASRRKLVDVARELLDAEETLNAFKALFAGENPK